MNLADPGMSVLDLADLTAHLPRGCALWVATGGRWAWTVEAEATFLLEHRLRVLAWQKTEAGRDGREYPQLIQPPPMAHEIATQEAEAAARKQKYLDRQQRRNTP